MPREPFEGSVWGERDPAPRRRDPVDPALGRGDLVDPAPRRRVAADGAPGDGASAGGRRRGRVALALLLGACGLAALGFVVANATGFPDSGEVGEVEFAAAEITAPVERMHSAQRARIRKLMNAPFVLGIPRKRLEAIAECESHGDPRAIGGGGLYRGKYQFHRGTWASVGGVGDPARASELEQDRRAAMLIKRSGSNPWPICGS